LHDHADDVLNKTYKTDQEGKIKDDRFDERLMVFEEYVKRGPADFHTSVIGPLCLYADKMYRDQYHEIFRQLGVREHIRVYTGFFVPNVNNTKNIVADHFLRIPSCTIKMETELMVEIIRCRHVCLVGWRRTSGVTFSLKV
jgi:hypothetical protein